MNRVKRLTRNFPNSINEQQGLYSKDTPHFNYYLKDHLGNVRGVFDEKGQILQQTDYYPFGLEIDRNDEPTITKQLN